MERRQVTEIPPVQAEVTEHQMVEKECPCCGARTKAEAPDGVTAPARYGPRAAAIGAYLWHGQFLSRDRACQALGEMFGCEPPPPAVIAAAAKKIAAAVSSALDAIIKALLRAEVAHFDEIGFRVAGKLAWVHSASAGRYVLHTVHAKRGTEGMDAAGVLASFAGIAVHDAWAVPIAVFPARPITRSPSQWPGTFRPSASAGRCEIDTIPTIRAPLERARPRGWRRVWPVRSAISIAASSPFGNAYSQV